MDLIIKMLAQFLPVRHRLPRIIMRQKTLLVLCALIVGWLMGCQSHEVTAPKGQSHLAERWQVAGTDNIVMLFEKDHSARLTSDGKTSIGRYQWICPDLIKVTLPGNAPQWAERAIMYHIPLDHSVGGTLTFFTDTRSSSDVQATNLSQKLNAVTVGDGISKSEAELIAECYFYHNVGCGGFTGIRDGGGFWIVDGAFGYAAKPIKGFHIDKTSGKITSPIGPSYATPFEIFQ